MKVIATTLDATRLGDPVAHRNLAVFPLIGPDTDDRPRYLTLDEALAGGHVRVREVDRSGSVPELKLFNGGDLPVLLLDGEELVGAKQNRVLNLTILAPAHSEIVIPVSCVEAGRWGYSRGGERFASSKNVLYSRARARKSAQVNVAIRRMGVPRSDQAAVWDDIARCSAELGAPSPSDAMEDIYTKHDATIEDYVRALPSIEGQAGAVFAIDGRILGLELLDHAETAARLVPKLVRSYALDAIASRADVRQVPPVQAVRDLIGDVAAADTSATGAVGLGQDVRLSTRGLTGGALVVDGRVVHLAAFRLDEHPGRDDGGDGGRMDSFSRRLRRRTS